MKFPTLIYKYLAVQPAAPLARPPGYPLLQPILAASLDANIDMTVGVFSTASAFMLLNISMIYAQCMLYI
jgi:hypothetical protein